MTTTVTLNPDQEEIRGVARSFLEDRYPSDRVRELMETPAGFEQSDWDELVELGWTGIAVPEERGGAGYGVVERCLLLEEMGRVLMPGPFLSSAVLAVDAMLLAGEGDGAEEALTGVVDGSTRASLVTGGDLGGGTGAALAARANGGRYELSGTTGLALDAHTADLLIAVAALEDGELGLFAIPADADGVARNPVDLIDRTRKAAVVEFDRAAAERLDGGDACAAIARALDRGAVALAAEMVGGARRTIEMTVSYMHEREQFGGPIGRFQALKHRLADLHVRIDAARLSVYAAADAIATDQSEQVPMLVAAARHAASSGYVAAAGEAIQLHGGIGFTEEHDIGLYYKRALVSAETLGNSADQVEKIAVGLDV